MFKLLLSGIAVALISLTGNTQAQIPPASTTPTPKLQPTLTTSTPLKATDLPLLTRAIGKFWQTDRAETESKMEIDLSDEKGKNKIFVFIKTIAKVGQKLRSELTILHLRGSANDRVGKTAKIKYTIVCDGKKVWIYRPDLRQYAQIDDSNFFYGKPSSSIVVGLFSILFTSLDEARRQELAMDILGENNKIVALDNFKGWQVSQQQINSRNLFVYTFDDSEAFNSKITGVINPQMAMFEQIELKFDNKSRQIKIVETIIKRNSQVAITDKTFTFSPPKGVKKVKSLEIGPFKF
jgi:outer membrane lipoprotein-sorting protein